MRVFLTLLMKEKNGFSGYIFIYSWPDMYNLLSLKAREIKFLLLRNFLGEKLDRSE
jgi:hypothetical protein